MKKIQLLFVIFYMVSCSKSVSNTYRGYVYQGNKPTKNLKVLEEDTNNYSYTNKEGFFQLKRKNTQSIKNLIFINSTSNEIDTIRLLRGGGAGSARHYLFLSNVDTINLEREREFKTHTQ